MDSKIYIYLSISRNGQLGCPFHEMDNFLVHFMKWTISHLGRNTETKKEMLGHPVKVNVLDVLRNIKLVI